MLIGGAGRGSQRRLVLFQVLTKLIGAVVLLPLVVLEMATGGPLLLAAVQVVAGSRGGQLAVAFARLSAEIRRFLDGLTASKKDAALPRALVDRLLNLRARNDVLVVLHETLFQLARVRQQLPPGSVSEPAEPLTEELGTVLLCLDDAARLPDQHNVAVLRQLTSERSTVVDGMRWHLIRVANQDAADSG